jgi:predicted nucleotidyltransferase
MDYSCIPAPFFQSDEKRNMRMIDNTESEKNDFNIQLYERAKELKCMYMVDEVIQNKMLTLPVALAELINTIPAGFTVPFACRVQLTVWSDVYCADDFPRAEILYRSPLTVMDKRVGEVAVGYIKELLENDCELLSDEMKLLDTIALRISEMIADMQRELVLMLDMLTNIDPDMLLHIGEKLRIHLKKTVGASADCLFDDIGLTSQEAYGEVNTPTAKPAVMDAVALRERLIAGATAFLPQGEARELISGWVREQRILTLVKVVDNKDARMNDILDAVRKYTEAMGTSSGTSNTETWLISELLHRFITNDERMINLVLDSLRISDFKSALEQIIGSDTSRGNIGGKGAGLFLAKQILARAAETEPLLGDIKTPRTWYLATDQMVDFLHYNNLEDLNSYKYNSPFHLRITYNKVVSKIKNAKMPPHTVRMLRIVLEEADDTPLIVRSSSLLEDRQGSAFSGKYKSLFLPNQGTRQQRLEALIDAILEVYSSMYNPDAISYRREMSLLNFSEQMGILIQEVVGYRLGKYYLPDFAGVAFSRNSLRWSARVKPEDGLVRMVMGLGTRAVDRVNDDYPALFSVAHPELRVNQTPADIRHYSPKHIDLINLEENRFETLSITAFLKEAGTQMPGLHNYVSVFSDDFIENKNAFTLDTQKDEMVVTFSKVMTTLNIPAKLKRILEILSEKMDTPVDIEFAYDGKDLYLLQCRPQGLMNSAPAPIPQNLNPNDILFTANRFISDGLVKDITHIVYVDGDEYNALSTREELYAVGEAIGMLGNLLPRRRYILMGPGRWGSRGDLRLGVRVTYSDISGTAALIEIAKKKHSYVPELSFGTHFFQDLVEAGIVYIPLYPDQQDVIFKEGLLRSSDNILEKLLPQYASLSSVIKVIDVSASFYGKTLSIHMNSDLEQAVAFFTDSEPAGKPGPKSSEQKKESLFRSAADTQDHWQWRHFMAQKLAETMDMDSLGVKGIYLFGSTNTGYAGIGSDIDLIVHVNKQDDTQRINMENWLDGWSRALAQINYLRTGYMTDKMLDVHVVTDQDIREGNSFAKKITSFTDPATPLRINE